MTHKRGSTPSNVRDTNIKLIMQLLYHADCSRTELAEKTELSNPALTKIVGELISLGFVKESLSISNGERGRKQVQLEVNDSFASVIGIDFSSDDIKIVLAGFSKEVVAKRVLPDCEIITREVLARIIELVKELLAVATSPVKCICIGLPGKVNAQTGLLYKTQYKYQDCQDVSLVDLFEEAFNIKTILANDASLQILAENAEQSLSEDTVLLYNDYGTGGALWLNGKLFESQSGLASEFGAIPVVYNGETLIFEDICSINAMFRESGYECNSFAEFLEGYRFGGKKENRAVTKSAQGMALLIRSIVGVTGASEIIINGKVCDLGYSYIEKINAFLQEEKILDLSALKIRYGRLGHSGTIMGAIEKAIDFVIKDEIKKRNNV